MKKKNNFSKNFIKQVVDAYNRQRIERENINKEETRDSTNENLKNTTSIKNI